MMNYGNYSEEMGNTIEYYNANADEFFNHTFNFDLEHLYNKFTPLLPPGGIILDAGCGSGRDALYFLKKGFRVQAFDASVELAKRAEQYTGINVEVLSFFDLKYKEEFDGIWANASLLHLPFSSLIPAFEKLLAALKPRGFLYASFKYGNGEVEKDGRFFSYLDENKLSELLNQLNGILIAGIWKTEDQRPDHAGEAWINVILRKV